MLVVALTASTAIAAPGDLDPSFDLDGFVATNIGTGGGNAARAVATQSDGKIVAAGYSGNGSSLRIAVLRYDTNGTLDATFGDGGIVVTEVGADGSEANGVAIQDDDKIVVVGSTAGFDNQLALVRYNPDGSLDESFDGDGIAATPAVTFWAQGRAVAIAADGKIVVAGRSGGGIVVVRYTSDGSVDTTFAVDGVSETIINGGSDEGAAIAIQGDGKIVVAGIDGALNGGDRDFAVLRYDVDGILDPSFDGDGIATTSFDGLTGFGFDFDDCHAMTIQADGKIVAAGSANLNYALVRYNTDGSLDTGFDGDGRIVTASMLSGVFYSVAVQGDARIVTVGRYGNDFAIARYMPDGSSDTSFAGDGLVTATVGTTYGSARAFVLGSDDAITVAGEAYNGQTYDVALTRYDTNGILVTGFGTDGVVLTDFGPSSDYAYAVATQPDGKIVAAGYSLLSPLAGTLVRYNSDGSLDASFDGDGIVTTGGPIYSIAIQGDGKIVGAESTTPGYFGVTRFLPNGSLDATFDGDGIATTATGGMYDSAYSMAIGDDGKIVVAGMSGDTNALILVRYDSDGSLDTTFDEDGIVTFGPFDLDFGDRIVVIQGDGGILVTGWSYNTSPDLAVVRFHPDGSLDTGFGGDGIASVDVQDNSSDVGRAIALQDDGKIVVAGRGGPFGSGGFVIVRFNTDGSPDSSFGVDGVVLPAMGYSRAETLAVQRDGKIVAAGYVVNTTQDVAIVRVHADGTLDESFGDAGLVTADFEGDTDQAQSLALQSDGKIVLSYLSDNPSGLDFTVARYFASDCGDGTVQIGESCDDENLVDGDGCNVGCALETNCPFLPLPNALCRTAAKAQLQVKRTESDADRNQLKWKWGGGAAFAQVDLGRPNLDTEYTLCVYDSDDNTPSLATWVDAAPGSSWGTNDPKGWNYVDKPGSSDGVQKVQLKTGADGKTKAQLTAGGTGLPVPLPVGTSYFAQDPGVVVQLIGSHGLCLTSEFATASRNDATQYKAKTP